MSALLVVISLVFLDLSKSQLVKQITRLIHHLGGGQKGTIITWSLIFLPGTIVHEISHFLVAALTGARTGRIEIFPEYLEEEENNGKKGVALGYVQTQTLNPIQGFLVGIAPFASGIALLVYLTSLIQNSYLNHYYQQLAFQGYFFFTIANSFFPSWSDIKQTLPLVAITGIIGIIFWLLGFQIFYTPTSGILSLIESLTIAIMISVGINLFIILVLFLINQVFSRR